MRSNFNKIDFIFSILIFSFTFYFGSLVIVPGVVGQFHDDGIYLSTAKSILENNSYSIPFLPQEISQTKYPPVYPLFLALILMFSGTFPDNTLYLEYSSVILAGLALSGAFLILRSGGYISRLSGVTALLLLGSSHLYLYFGSILMSEMLFSCLALVALFSFEKSLGEHQGRFPLKFYFSGISFALLTLCRSAGIFYIPFCLYYLRKSKLKVFCFLIGFLTLYLPWSIWSSIARHHIQSNFEYTYYSGYLSWFDTVFPIYHKVLLYNLLETIFIFPIAFFESFSIIAGDQNPFWFIILLLGGFLYAGWVSTWKSKKFLVISSLPYMLALLFWPGPPLRMIVPVLPLLLPLMFDGLLSKLSKSKFPSISKNILLSFVFCALILNVCRIFEYQSLIQRTHFPFAELPEEKDVIYWKDYQATFDWIKQNTSEGDLVSSNLDPVIYLYTGRKSIMPYSLEAARWIYRTEEPPLGTDQEIISHIKNIKPNYLVVLPMQAESNRTYFTSLIIHLAEVYPEIFQLVYQGTDARFRIYRVTA